MLAEVLAEDDMSITRESDPLRPAAQRHLRHAAEHAPGRAERIGLRMLEGNNGEDPVLMVERVARGFDAAVDGGDRDILAVRRELGGFRPAGHGNGIDGSGRREGEIDEAYGIHIAIAA